MPIFREEPYEDVWFKTVDVKAAPFTLDDFNRAVETVREAGLPPQTVIFSTTAYKVWERIYYDGWRNVDWNRLIAPRLTRLQRRIRHAWLRLRYRWR